MLRRTALLAPALLLGAANRIPLAALPLSRLDTPWWRARHEQKLAELRAQPPALIWLGDSITQDWELEGPPTWRDFAPIWQAYYGGRRAINLGFKGDNTSHLLWRMQNGELDGITPRAAIVLIGANNMGRVHWNGSQTLAGITAVVDELHRRLADTRVILLGILPSIRSNYVTRTTAEVNRGLTERYGGGGRPWLTYLDVSAPFVRDGQVDRTQFYDDQLTPPDPPLHPTAQAQARIAAAIEPTLAAILGDRRRVHA